MILIDHVLSFDEEQIHTRLTVKPGGLFNQPDGSLPPAPVPLPDPDRRQC